MEQGDRVDFRAVKSKEGEDWQENKPIWTGNGWITTGDSAYEIFTQPTVGTAYEVIAVENLSTLTFGVCVTRKDGVLLSSTKERLLVGGQPNDLASTVLRAQVIDYWGHPRSGATVSFKSVCPDGTQAGNFNGEGPETNTRISDENGIAEITLTSGQRVDTAIITATIVNPKSEDDDSVTITVNPPTADYQFGEWHLVNGVQTQQCILTLAFDGETLTNRHLKLAIKILNTTSGQNVSLNEGGDVQLSIPGGTTDAEGKLGFNVTWQPGVLNVTPPPSYEIVVDAQDPLGQSEVD